MPRGGKREGAGRKAQGITRKVSLTLSAEEWQRIEDSGEQTIAAYLQSLMNKVTPVIETTSETEIHSESDNPIHKGMNRKEVEEYWSIFSNFEKSAAPEVLEGAKATFLRILFPKGMETAQLEVKPNFICPFTGKRFGSMKALIKAAVPHLAESESRRLKNLGKSL